MYRAIGVAPTSAATARRVTPSKPSRSAMASAASTTDSRVSVPLELRFFILVLASLNPAESPGRPLVSRRSRGAALEVLRRTLGTKPCRGEGPRCVLYGAGSLYSFLGNDGSLFASFPWPPMRAASGSARRRSQGPRRRGLPAASVCRSCALARATRAPRMAAGSTRATGALEAIARCSVGHSMHLALRPPEGSRRSQRTPRRSRETQ